MQSKREELRSGGPDGNGRVLFFGSSCTHPSTRVVGPKTMHRNAKIATPILLLEHLLFLSTSSRQTPTLTSEVCEYRQNKSGVCVCGCQPRSC